MSLKRESLNEKRLTSYNPSRLSKSLIDPTANVSCKSLFSKSFNDPSGRLDRTNLHFSIINQLKVGDFFSQEMTDITGFGDC